MRKGCYLVLLAGLWMVGCERSDNGLPAADAPPAAPATLQLITQSPDELDSHLLCSEPLNAFLDELSQAVPETRLAADQVRFGGLIEACKRAYQAELNLLEHTFAELPADSQCRQKGREYRLAEGLFDDINADLQSLPTEVLAQPETYQERFTILATGLMIQLTMVTMHRVGHCQTEYALQF